MKSWIIIILKFKLVWFIMFSAECYSDDELWIFLFDITDNAEKSCHPFAKRKTYGSAGELHLVLIHPSSPAFFFLHELYVTNQLSECFLGVKRQWDIKRCGTDYSVTPAQPSCCSWPCCNLSPAARAAQTEIIPLCLVSLVAALLLRHLSSFFPLKVILCFSKRRQWDSKVMKLTLGALFGKSRAPSASSPSGTLKGHFPSF